MPKEDYFTHTTHRSTTTHNRNSITAEMREAYRQVLREKEQIIEQIHEVQEELRQGGIETENLEKEEERLREQQSKTTMDSKKKDDGRRYFAPSPTPQPAPQPPRPPPPPPPKIRSPSVESPVHDPIPPPEEETLQTQTSFEPIIVPEDIERRVKEKMANDPHFHDSYEIPATPAPSREQNAYKPSGHNMEYSYQDYSDSSLLRHGELHSEIAAMHLAIQKRACLAGAFILLLLFLMVFY